MSLSATQILYVLELLKKALKDAKSKAKTIKEVRVDDKKVSKFEIKNFELEIGSMELEIVYIPEGAKAETSVRAKHIFRSDEPDTITVNSREVEDDNVDLDIDLHLLRADVEYRLTYLDAGTPHEIFMLASVDWYRIKGD